MTWLFLLLAVVVVVATALALAGRWHPEGLAAGPPPTPAPPLSDGGSARFDVVLRGYRMDQVDTELARLRQLLQQEASSAEMPEQPSEPTIEA